MGKDTTTVIRYNEEDQLTFSQEDFERAERQAPIDLCPITKRDRDRSIESFFERERTIVKNKKKK